MYTSQVLVGVSTVDSLFRMLPRALLKRLLQMRHFSFVQHTMALFRANTCEISRLVLNVRMFMLYTYASLHASSWGWSSANTFVRLALVGIAEK